MLSKKQSLGLAVVAIAGTGVGLMVLGGGGGDKGEEGEETPETKKELLMRYEAPVYAPSEIYAPYTESTITDIVYNVITRVWPPDVPPVTSKRVYHTEKWRQEQREAGVQGYLTSEQQAKFDRGEPVNVSITPLKKRSTTSKKTATGRSYGSRSHTVSKSGMHTVTSVSKKGVVSKKAYR